MNLFRHSNFRYLLIIAALSLPACTALPHKNSAKEIEKVADIDNDPITRLSFVPMNNAYNDIQIIVYQDEEYLNNIMPASGEKSPNNIAK